MLLSLTDLRREFLTWAHGNHPAQPKWGGKSWMPSHTPLHHIMKGLFTAVSFTKYIMSKGKNKQIKQASKQTKKPQGMLKRQKVTIWRKDQNWVSRGKNTAVVWHSLFQWTTFNQRSKQLILKERTLHNHWKDWCWSWSANTLATWWEEMTH